VKGVDILFEREKDRRISIPCRKWAFWNIIPVRGATWRWRKLTEDSQEGDPDIF